MASFHPTMSKFYSLQRLFAWGMGEQALSFQRFYQSWYKVREGGSLTRALIKNWKLHSTPLPSWARQVLSSTTSTHWRRRRLHKKRHDTRVQLPFFLWSLIITISNHEATRGLRYRVRGWEGHEDVHVIVQWLDQAGGERVVEKWRVRRGLEGKMFASIFVYVCIRVTLCIFGLENIWGKFGKLRAKSTVTAVKEVDVTKFWRVLWSRSFNI